MEKYLTNIFYWIIRIALYYFISEEIERIDTPITFIVTTIFIYYSPYIMFKPISEFLDKVDKCTKKSK